MATSIIQPSFGAGELSPSLFGRVDLAKYHSGLALARNVFVDYRGGVSNRPGTQYIATLAGPGQPRAIPFIVSTTSAYILVFGTGYIQFFQNGAYIGGADLVSPYAASDLPLLKYVQSANVLTLTHPSYPVYNLTQTGPSIFVIAAQVVGSSVPAPGTLSGAATPTVKNDGIASYVVTAVGLNGVEESLPSNRINIITDLTPDLSSTDFPMTDLGWVPASGAIAGYKVYKSGPTNARAHNPVPVNSVLGLIGQTTSNNFTDANIVPDYSQTPPLFQDPFSPGQIQSVVVLTGGAGAYTTQYTIPLIFSGGGGSGAAGYAIIDPTTNNSLSVVMTNFGKGYTTAPTVTDSVGAATYAATLGQLSGTYPACATYFQQRRVFGGTPNFPESFVMSQPGSYQNFNTSPFSSQADAITASIASRQNNSIKSMVAMPTGLIIFTTGGGFLISGGNQQAAVTPSDIVAFPQASSGANDVPPLVVNYDVLYVQNRGATVRDLAFNFYVQSYTGTDRSVLSAHLFLGYLINEWCYAEEPFRLIHAVRNDGTLLTFTYVPEQEVFAWTHYDTNGLYCSVASIPENQQNAVYIVTQRNIAGTLTYFLERVASRVFNSVEDTWFLDAALALAQTTPAANLSLTGAAGTVGATITLIASAAVFSAPQVGYSLWAGGGHAVITGFTDSTHLTAQVQRAFPLVPNDPTGGVIGYASGTWDLDANVTTVSGLGHLTGMQVSALADGVPVLPQLCVAGAITLPQPASKVVVGLAYQAQIQTLKLDTGDPTVQGKRKNIIATTLRVDKTLGLKVGPDFATLTEVKDSFVPFTSPNPLMSTDLRTIIQAVWKVDGQLAFQQDPPLPFTLLANIPEVVPGDTAR